MTTAPKAILERFRAAITIRPAAAEEQIARFRSQQPGPLSTEVVELLRFSEGFEVDLRRLLNSRHRIPTAPLRFTGSGGLGLLFLADAVDLLGDGLGNFWVVDVDANGAWGPVMFVCHDPPVMSVQAQDLATFLLQILDPESSEPTQALKFVHELAVTRIWSEDSWLMGIDEARLSQDQTLLRFANQLTHKFCIADLRSKRIGSGFSWGKAGRSAKVIRDGSELLFAVEKKTPGVLMRLFSRA